MDYVLQVETAHINFSPTGFRFAAKDFLAATISLITSLGPGRFSVVPYFLCCRAIELALKAIHLETDTQAGVKRKYRHNLLASYEALPRGLKALSSDEYAVLCQSSQLYAAKRFEYVQPIDAGTAYTAFPPLDSLRSLTERILQVTAA